MNSNSLLQNDFYKQGHKKMYVPGASQVYSNLTPRKSRIDGVNEVVVFGPQYFIKKYLIEGWNNSFFSKPWEEVSAKFLRIINNTLGPDAVEIDHIKKLHDLGYLPLRIKSLPEGELCPIKVPFLTITNTVDHAFWLVNFLETILSCTTWQPCTSATIAYEFRKLVDKYAIETTGSTNFSQWQCHDFSYRGMSSHESACLSGAGHLLSFTGTDTIPAIEFLEEYYNANVEKELVGASVPASEHSIMSLGMQDGEIATFERLLNTFPKGILSVVSDTWSLPNVVCNILPRLKDQILAREGKLVIRPDSFWTDPVDCLCGFDGYHPQMDKLNNEKEINFIYKGLIESLGDLFGTTTTEQGYKLLHPSIGAIYGDSISLDRVKEISERLKKKGYASTNSVYGVGSFTYQFNTRDTFGFAMKATFGVVNGEPREIFKDPITDDGMKKSARGLLRVEKIENKYVLKDQVSFEEEAGGELKTIFENGKLIVDWSLSEIRSRIDSVRVKALSA